MPYRKHRITTEDMVEELDRCMTAAKSDIGSQLKPVFSDMAREIESLMESARMPTRLERLGMWMARCPAAPWRQTRSRSGEVVAHEHGPITGLVARAGRWLAP